MPTPPNASIPSPLRLSDDQISTIMQLSRPLQPNEPVMFFEMVAAKLQGRADVGDGALFRICRELQRELLIPPLETRQGSGNGLHRGKYW
jgi:hypothetical protein